MNNNNALNVGDLLMEQDANGKWQLGWVTIPRLKSTGLYSDTCQSEWKDDKLGLMKVMLSINEALIYRNNYLLYRNTSNCKE